MRMRSRRMVALGSAGSLAVVGIALMVATTAQGDADACSQFSHIEEIVRDRQSSEPREYALALRGAVDGLDDGDGVAAGDVAVYREQLDWFLDGGATVDSRPVPHTADEIVAVAARLNNASQERCGFPVLPVDG